VKNGQTNPLQQLPESVFSFNFNPLTQYSSCHFDLKNGECAMSQHYSGLCGSGLTCLAEAPEA